MRRLNQKQQQKPPQPLDEKCPKCGEQLVLRNGQYGEFVSCSGYPKCKYIKQNTIGVKVSRVPVRANRREESAPRQPLLWLLGISEVRLYRELQAGRQEVPGVRQPLSAGEDPQVRRLPRLPQQQESLRQTKKRHPKSAKRRTRPEAQSRAVTRSGWGMPHPGGGSDSYSQDAWAGSRAAGSLGRLSPQLALSRYTHARRTACSNLPLQLPMTLA